jgi:multidrug transporter EmrE-like cation transporter
MESQRSGGIMSALLGTAWGQWVGIAISVLSGAIAQTLMKHGTRRLGSIVNVPFFDYLVRLATSPLIWLSIITYGVGVIFYMIMLSRLDLSYLYPVMTALGLTAAVLISALVFREHITLTRLAGIVVVAIGVFLVARSA